MKVAAIFNKIDTVNTGLEAFVSGSITEDKVIVVLKQRRAEAEEALANLYPECRIPVYVPKVSGFGNFVSGIRLLVDQDFSVLHPHHAKGAVVAACVRLLKRVRLVTTAHNSFRNYKLRYKMAFALAFLLSDRVVSNSFATKETLPKFVKHKNSLVIYNGVDVEKITSFCDDGARRRLSEATVIGSVGRMVPAKDITTMVKAFKVLHGKFAGQVELLLVGDGPERKAVEKLIREMGLQSAVKLTGELSRPEVYNMLQEMDIFVVSSRFEGFCNAMVEAAAAGKPIVATEIPPLVEVLGKQNGRFFEVGEVGELAYALERLTGDADLRQMLAHRSAEVAHEFYSIHLTAKKYENIYIEEINRSRSDALQPR